MFLALLSFLPFGLLFAALTVVIKQGTVGTSWVIALLSIVGGLYFPVSLLPEWLQTISKLQPFTPATDVLRHLLVEQPAGELDRGRAAEDRAVRRGAAAGSIVVLSAAIRLGPAPRERSSSTD